MAMCSDNIPMIMSGLDPKTIQRARVAIKKSRRGEGDKVSPGSKAKATELGEALKSASL
jgi:hypothetical protein